MSRETTGKRCSSSQETSTSWRAALVRVLADRPLAERLGNAAFERYQEWHTTPAEYAARVRSLVEASLHRAETMKAGRS